MSWICTSCNNNHDDLQRVCPICGHSRPSPAKIMQQLICPDCKTAYIFKKGMKPISCDNCFYPFDGVFATDVEEDLCLTLYPLHRKGAAEITLRPCDSPYSFSDDDVSFRILYQNGSWLLEPDQEGRFYIDGMPVSEERTTLPEGLTHFRKDTICFRIAVARM